MPCNFVLDSRIHHAAIPANVLHLLIGVPRHVDEHEDSSPLSTINYHEAATKTWQLFLITQQIQNLSIKLDFSFILI